jgi:hypothetical protein
MWKNIVELDMVHMTIQRMRIAYWMPNPRNTLRKFNVYCFSIATMVARKHLMFIIHTLSVLFILRVTTASYVQQQTAI